MPDEVRHVLDEEESRAENGNVFGQRRENTIVPIATVVAAVTQLAEPLAGWPRGDKFDVADTPGVGLQELTPFCAQQICIGSDAVTEVVIVDSDRFFPRVVGLRDVEAECSEANSDPTKSRAQLHRCSVLMSELVFQHVRASLVVQGGSVAKF
jgi:hypothetical protein